MTPEEYAEEVARTAVGATEDYLLLGLISEIGEVADVLKKGVRVGADPDREKLVDECGDVLWYAFALSLSWGEEIRLVFVEPRALSGWRLVFEMARGALDVTSNAVSGVDFVAYFLSNVDVSFEEAAAANVRKLRARHPGGYNHDWRNGGAATEGS